MLCRARFPGLILATLSLMLQSGPATLSQGEREQLVSSSLLGILLALVEDHPNL
jgi:hypothetical protein